MAKTISEAFSEFMQNSVDLDPKDVVTARYSRDNLLENIGELDCRGFFRLYPDVNIQFGSFARKTKKRPLDDIDLMIGIAADNGKYYAEDPWNDIRIKASPTNFAQQVCLNDDGVTLNSTKVLNLFKSKLENIRDYSRSEIHKNGEAVTLNLKTRDWAFDIVPCFFTEQDEDNGGRTYYLIPNGQGGWQKTDPRIDRDYIGFINRKYKGAALPLIRLCKKWNEVKQVKTLPSYLLETIIVDYFKSSPKLYGYFDLDFWNILAFLQTRITSPVYDIKGIQGDLSRTVNTWDRAKIAWRAKTDCEKIQAVLSNHSTQEECINLWREIFGQEFPTYG